MNPRQVIIEEAQRAGVDPAIALSIWEQEGGGSTDLSMRGPTLPKGKWKGHYARGPWQIMSFHGEIPDDFRGQTRWAMQHLKERGVRGYYGTGTPVVPGHPTTDQYEAEVLARAGKIDPRTASVDPTMAGPAVDPNMLPSTAADMNGPDAMFDPAALSDQQLIQLGILPSKPQPSTNQMAQQSGFFADPYIAMGMGILGNPSNNLGVSVAKGYQVAQEAMRQQQLLNADLTRAQPRSSARLPANIQEILLLKRMYPSLSDEDILQMAFTGAVRGPGEELRQVGSVTVRRDRDQFGRPIDRPVDTGTQEVIEQRTEDVSQAGERGTRLGRMEVETPANVGVALGAARSALSATEDMLARFEAGEFDNASGPIRGRLGQFLNPETAQIQRYEMDRALANLGMENLAPVSNYEIDLIRRMDASAFNTPEMNKAILRDIVRIRKAKVDALQRTLERLRTESIEEYLEKGPVAVEMPELESTNMTPAPGGERGNDAPYNRDEVVDELNRMGL
jgi:hypothetical protein